MDYNDRLCTSYHTICDLRSSFGSEWILKMHFSDGRWDEIFGFGSPESAEKWLYENVPTSEFIMRD